MMDNLRAELDLLGRHVTILKLVIENEPIGIVALADETGHEHYEVRYSLRVLEEGGLVEPTKRGATSTQDAASLLAELPDRIDELGEKLRTIGTETMAAAD